jgi:hypothetical protein
MKHSSQRIRVLMLALFATGTAVAQAAGGDKPVTVKLDAQNASGEKGTATLTPQGEKTRIVLKLSGAPADIAQPAHIHEGSCAKLDPKPKIPLQNVVKGTSTTVVGVSLDSIMSGSHAINVHKSSEDVKTYVACGDLGKG